VRWCLQSHGKITGEYYRIFGYEQSPKLEELGFSRLHKAFFGMLQTELAVELQFSTSEVDTPDTKGATPLLWATQLKDSRAVQLLLETGADPRVSDAMGTTPLHYAWSLPYEDFLLLLEKGADPNAVDSYNETALHYCCRALSDIRFAKSLITRGADPNIQDLNGWSALHWLARYDHAHVLDYLISHGAAINPRSYVGWTPLFFAVRYNSHRSLQTLLATGATMSTVTSQGDSLLHYAAAFADETTLAILANTSDCDAEPQLKSYAWEIGRGITPKQLFDERRASISDALRLGFDNLLLRCGQVRAATVQSHLGQLEEYDNYNSDLPRIPGEWQ
jgi:ankyrin repeat protein